MGKFIQNNWGTIVVAAVVLILAGLAVYSMYRAKKRGAACIGCPYAGNCPKLQSGNSEQNCK
ncbi:MAG: FeoB-associated Cys-rich membrane protein [Christensenellaceae bacterium]|jgi:hypothetical protein